MALAADTHGTAVARRHRHAVGVADGKRRDPGRSLRPEERAVANGVTRLNLMHVSHSGLERHCRLQRRFEMGRRADTVEHQTRTHRVGFRQRFEHWLSGQEPGRVRAMDDGRLNAAVSQRRQDLAEAGELGKGRPQILLVGPREVRGDAFQLERRFGCDRLSQPRCFARRDAHPVHAGIDLDVDGNLHVLSPRRCSQWLQLLSVMDDGRKTRLHGQQRRIVDAAEHEDGNLHVGVPQRPALLHRRDGQPLATCGDQGKSHRHRPVAIGLGLHHGDHAPALGPKHRLSVVRTDRVEVDGGHRRTLLNRSGPAHAGSKLSKIRRKPESGV